MDPTADITDTFIAETLFDGFEKFEASLAQRAKQHAAVKLTAGGLASPDAQCSYKLDSNRARPAIVVVVASMTQQDQRTKFQFVADAVGMGILNMRLVWRDENGGQLLNSDELAEFCFNELLALTPVA
jgi:hypothetical protein